MTSVFLAASRPAAAPETGRDDSLDTAYAVGWDHARHGLTPPLERLCINPALQRGFREGRALFGSAPAAPPPALQRWLALRLEAVARGLAFEAQQLTPRALARLEVSRCPITRERLVATPGDPAEAQWVRARLDAGLAVGNLLMASRRAREARESVPAPVGTGYREALARARQCEAQPNGPARQGGLTGEQWWRAALLASYVQPLPHDEAAALPMRVLPPLRLRLFNPVQALQALCARALLHPTPNRRFAALREALPTPAVRTGFDAHATVLHEAVAAAHLGRPALPLAWAIEDAWCQPILLGRWKAFARTLGAAECLAVVRTAGAGLAFEVPDGLATEGWALDTAGRVRTRPVGLRLVLPPARRAAPLPPRRAAVPA